MSDETTTEMLAEIDRDMVEIETLVADLARQSLQADYPQQVETTTEMLAELEGQATEYTPPDGWRVVRFGEQLLPGDVWVSHDGTEQRSHILHWDASAVSGGHCIRRIEPEPQPEPEPEKVITPDDVAGEALAGVWDQAKAEQQIAELQAQVAFLKNRELTLGTRLDEEKTVTTKRLQQVEELRSEVSYVQGLLGTERRRVTQLEELVTSLRTINEAQEKAFEAAGKENTDLQHRLNVVAAEWAEQAETTRRLQIELDAREQVPQAVSDRFEEGWDKGTAQAVETIAEWTEVFRTCGSQGLSYHVMQNLPHIMRSLTGLTEED